MTWLDWAFLILTMLSAGLGVAWLALLVLAAFEKREGVLVKQNVRPWGRMKQDLGPCRCSDCRRA